MRYYTVTKTQNMKTYLLTALWACLVVCGTQATEAYNEKAAAAWGIYCPSDAYATCTDELWNLSAYGWAYVHDYSGYTYLYNPVVEHHLSSCNTGYITRTWSAYNPYSNTWHSCTQTIHVTGGGGYGNTGGFGYQNIHWPQSPYTVYGCNPDVNPYNFPAEYGAPTYDYVACSQIGVAYTDAVFTVNQTCKKIIRTWKVVDWCQHNPYTGKGKWTYDQEIKIMENTPPAYTCPDDITVSSNNCKNATVYVAPLTVDATACGGYATVTNTSPYAFSNGADISGVYPIGTTKVKYIISYGCGYKKNCTVNVTVSKDKPPTPYCLHTVTTALMGVDTDGDGVVDDGMVEIWAKDLDKDSRPACGGGPLRFSFSSDVNDMSKTFTCANVGRNPVQVWVTDHYGNQDWCLAYVEVQNNGARIPNCEPVNYVPHPHTPHYASGRIATQWEEPIEFAAVSLTDMDVWLPAYLTDTVIHLTIDTITNQWGDMAFIESGRVEIVQTQIRPTEHPTTQMQTGNIGQYMFNDALAPQASYMLHVEPGSVDSDVEQIRYDDAYAVMKHVMGIETLQDPYAIIAADVNSDGDITIHDFRAIYHYVKYGTPLMKSNLPAWITVNASYRWDNAMDALSYCPDEIYFTTDNADVTGQNFIAIRKGDVNRNTNLHNDRDIKSLMAINTIPTALGQEQVTELRSILDESGLSLMQFAPNPFHDEITLQMHSALDQNIAIKLYTTDGKLIHQEKLYTASGNHTINVRPETDYRGIIIYEITANDQTYNGRLLKM